jgi:hypothetical protein
MSNRLVAVLSSVYMQLEMLLSDASDVTALYEKGRCPGTANCGASATEGMSKTMEGNH